jgi:hypothetical protein
MWALNLATTFAKLEMHPNTCIEQRHSNMNASSQDKCVHWKVKHFCEKLYHRLEFVNIKDPAVSEQCETSNIHSNLMTLAT